MEKSNNNNTKQEESTEQNKEALEFVGKLELNSLKKDTILKIKINNAEALMSVLLILKERYSNVIQEKNVTVLALGKDDSVEELDESQMEAFGWVKKNKSRIITLS